MTEFLVLSETSCYKANSISPEYGEAWAFAKQLSSLNKHPIIFNFKANFTGIRILLGYTDRKFRTLVNLAIAHRLIRFDGTNLHIQGKQADRRLFGKLRRKQEIKTADIKSFYQISVLKNNIKQQTKAYKIKSSTMFKGRGNGEPDTLYTLHNTTTNEVTLSIRKIAELLGLTVHSAYALSKDLVAFGLTLKLNKVSIDRTLYNHYIKIGRYWNARKTDAGQFFYLKASIPSFGPFYKVEQVKSVVKESYYTSDAWLSHW